MIREIKISLRANFYRWCAFWPKLEKKISAVASY